MEHRFTRQELYDRVWSKPMSHIVSELGTTTGVLGTLLRRAGIPTPPAGYWMRKDFGKPVVQQPLPPTPAECTEPLLLDTGRPRAMRRPRLTEGTATPKADPVPKPDIPAQLIEVPVPMPALIKPRPTQPTTITRDDLYSSVWTTPMIRLAEQFGISGNGLAKICDREKIPYPPRGYWAKLAVGRAPAQPALPESGGAHAIIIRPTPLPPPPIDLPPEVQQLVDKARASEPAIDVSERLLRPHGVIAAWLAEHEEKKQRARRERDPWSRSLYDPGEFTQNDRRKHRILDALFKAIERHGGRVKQGDRRQLFAEVLGEKVEFQVREKQKQERRPPTADEKRWRSPDDNRWKQELVATGRLVFEIKTWQWPGGLRRQWVESDKLAMEDMLPDILTTFVAAGPLLVQQRKDREAAERERQIAEQRRYEEQRRRKRDANRWRCFKEMAQDWHELATVRDFLVTLRSMNVDQSAEIDGRSIEQWIAWAEDWLTRADPTTEGVDGIFRRIGDINDWTYHD
ncbi:hypothetical protein [Mesorhizobium sp. ES1-6]|uniref:hypothetical protein n=1 Tax=Mesorhizobium sp. ES1-6 TaxID=2876626 RepID=UPI001CCCF9A7|nr:hypothetical protein [Mesorhizobium sp. ES1-6]MBZ9801209.1 hypothetical protein [Mesorhizobium sp. ES1-6]